MNRNDFYAKAFQLLNKAKKAGIPEDVIYAEFRYAMKRTYG